MHRHLLAEDPSFRSRFRREMDAAKKVGGFYTAAVVDGDADADSPWYASAYIDAPTLADVLQSDGRLSEERATALGAGLAEAIAAIHKVGLIHRDLKPANALLAADGPRVIDFGIVRVEQGEDRSLTGTGNVIGTVGYLSPEQLAGAPLTGASDVFALGALLTFATTGPWPGLAGRGVELALRRDPDMPAHRGPGRRTWWTVLLGFCCCPIGLRSVGAPDPRCRDPAAHDHRLGSGTAICAGPGTEATINAPGSRLPVPNR